MAGLECNEAVAGEHKRGFSRLYKMDERLKPTSLRPTQLSLGARLMNRDARRQTLESFGRGPALLSAAVRNFPKKMWLFKPSPEKWSIHEIILHLADREASEYVRCRLVIAEPGGHIHHIDSARWAGSLGYFHQSTREALELVRRLRRMTYQVLAALPEMVWAQTTSHPRDGEISLERWIEKQERHIPHHIAQMVENYETWFGLHPPRRAASRSIQDRTPSRAPVRMA